MTDHPHHDLHHTRDDSAAPTDYRAWIKQLVAPQLEGAPEHELFVRFPDATNAEDTCGAGGYPDLAGQEGDRHDPDVNLAHAPSRAYPPAYSCPLPPPKNWLTARIEAGERNPWGGPGAA